MNSTDFHRFKKNCGQAGPQKKHSVLSSVLQTEKNISKKAFLKPQPRPTVFNFDIALSFASEDRKLAEDYCDILKKRGIRVFIDSDNKAELWGADLYVKLDEIYRSQAMYCVIFISKHYAAKRWTNHERQSAQARAFKDNKEYILPVRLDNTEIPGIRETIGYIDLRKTSIEDLANITLEKVVAAKKLLLVSK
jgi:hypothetical protein